MNTTTENITTDTLLARLATLRAQGWRLSAISSARLADTLELLYSFDLQYDLLNLRLEVPLTALTIPSISSIYFCAVLYENEMHDLFGLEVQGMAVDFKGNLYQTAVKYPFGSTKPPSTPTTTTTGTAQGAATPAAPATTTATNKS